jgi:ribonuclease Z
VKKSLIVLAVVAILGAVAYSQRGPIAMRLMAKGMEAAMTADTIADLPDGLHVALCGAGGPLPDPKRSGPCVVVVAGTKLFIVDAGTHGVRNLGPMRYPVGRIDAVLLTHFHSDHLDGLGELATGRWVQGNREPLTVLGPEGVQQVIEGFNTAYAQDAVYRYEHHGETVAAPSGHGMVARSFAPPENGELTPVYEADGVTIEMLAVDHAPVRPAVAYRFSYKERTALISGDTSKSSNLERFAQGVDLLVHDALAPNLVGLMHEAAVHAGDEITAKITVDILDYHATPREAAEIARDAGVGHLLYYHVVPPLVVPGLEAAWLDGADEVFSRYTIGEDGTSFSLPAGSKEILLTHTGL